MIRYGWLDAIDALAHRLHLPEFLLRPLCDAFDRSLGLTDDEIRCTPPPPPALRFYGSPNPPWKVQS